jgi:hypothetical protein
MPIYFQKISNKNFHPNKEFHVKDSKGCNMTVGILFFFAFVSIIYIDRFDTKHPSVYQLLYLSIIPAVYMIRRSIMNKILMTINKTGFYYFGELVTDWKNFIDASIIQDEENRRIPYDVTDRFTLLIRYFKEGEPGYFGRKFLMTATMDKSEEEIIAAIEFYYEQARKPVEVSIEPYPPRRYLNG